MQERIFYSDTGTRITSEYVRLGSKSFHISDISSVSVQTTQTDSARNLPSFLLVVGSLLMFGVTNMRGLLPADWENALPIAILAGMLISMSGLTVLVIQMFLKSDYLYILSINGLFGSVCPVASDDEKYIRKLASALTSAMQASREAFPAMSSPLADTV